jgi:hypothetical protein
MKYRWMPHRRALKLLVDIELVSDSPTAQQNPNVDETPPPQDAMVSLNFVIGSEIVLTCDFQEDRVNTPPPPGPAESNPLSVTQSSVSRKATAPSFASSFY